jgi:lipopolysaccharide exporter
VIAEDRGDVVVRGAVTRIAAYLLGLALSLVASALLLRHLGPARTGDYVSVISVVVLCAGLSDLGLAAVSLRDASLLAGAERAALVGEMLVVRAALSLVGVAVAIGYTAAAGYRGALIAGAAVAGLGYTVQTVQAAAATALAVDLRMQSVALADLTRQAVAAAAIAVLALAQAPLGGFFAVALLAAVAGLLVTKRLLGRGGVGRLTVGAAQARAAISRALPIGLASLAASLNFQVTILIVKQVADSTEAGYFAVGQRMLEAAIVLPALLCATVFPVLARAAGRDAARFAALLRALIEGCLVLGAGVAVVVVAGAPTVVRVLGGGEFAPAVPVLRWQAAGLTAVFVSLALSYGLLALGANRRLLLAAAGGLLVTTTGALIGAEGHGATGAAAGSFAGAVALLLIASAGVAGLETGRRVGLPRVGPVALAALVALAPSLALPSAPAAVLAALLYATVIVASGLVTPAVRTAFAGVGLSSRRRP